MRAIARSVAVMALSGATLAACGGGGGGSGLSTSEFRKQANAICVKGDAEVTKASKALFEGAAKGGEVPAETMAGFFKDKALPIVQRKIDGIGKLEVSKDLTERLQQAVAAGSRAVKEVRAGLEKDGAKYLSTKGPDPFKDFDASVRALGLDKCAAKTQSTPGASTPTTAG
jgi:hypothetical protein